MNNVASTVMTLIFVVGIIAIVAIVATFVLCIYLREFPKVKHKSEIDLTKNKFKNETNIETANKNNKHNKK